MLGELSSTECHSTRFIKFTRNPQTPKELGIFLSAPSWELPLFGTPVLHMCRYRYYSAHKMPQSHLKVVSCWNTLAASKLGSRLLQTAQVWPSFCTSNSSPMGNGPELAFVTQTCSRHQTLQGAPLKGSGLFLSRVVIFQSNLIWEKNDCGLPLHVRSGERKRTRRFSHSASVYLYFKTAFVLFLYVTEEDGRDETVLKEATVLISSEGSLLFFPPPISFLSPSTSKADLALCTV